LDGDIELDAQISAKPVTIIEKWWLLQHVREANLHDHGHISSWWFAVILGVAVPKIRLKK
jgi:hypothetical protein